MTSDKEHEQHEYLVTTTTTTTISSPTTNNKTKTKKKSWKRQINDFANAKEQCLYGTKRDKSSAGQIDKYAVPICNLLNALPNYYTTSSCSGRSFIYTGVGNKASSTAPSSSSTSSELPSLSTSVATSEPTTLDEITNASTDTTPTSSSPTAPNTNFLRRRVAHDRITDAERYFCLETIDTDPTGGGDTDHSHNIVAGSDNNTETSRIWWLRYEPFILHVACRTITDAERLLAAARPAFKNVAITTWNPTRYLVAIWGDEGLDMPLTNEHGQSIVPNPLSPSWLQSLVNDRHERNWNKINRFMNNVQQQIVEEAIQQGNEYEDLINTDDDENDSVEEWYDHDNATETSRQTNKVPTRIRSYDVVGDVAIVNTILDNDPNDTNSNMTKYETIGQQILGKNNAIQLVVARSSTLQGADRNSTKPFILLASRTTTSSSKHQPQPPKLRDPLITTHKEHGISCVVDLQGTFFNPRMSFERTRLCTLAQGSGIAEHILVVFAGVGLEAFLLAAKVPANQSITIIEQNPIAVQCIHSSIRMLRRNKALGTDSETIANKLIVMEGDAQEILPTLPQHYYHRIIAPRPKEPGTLDGDTGTGSHGAEYLQSLLSLIVLPSSPKDPASNKHETNDDSSNIHSTTVSRSGIIHWYDFVSEPEFADNCQRTRQFLMDQVQLYNQNWNIEFLTIIKVGSSVAKRQLRICIDFCVVTA